MKWHETAKLAKDRCCSSGTFLRLLLLPMFLLRCWYRQVFCLQDPSIEFPPFLKILHKKKYTKHIVDVEIMTYLCDLPVRSMILPNVLGDLPVKTIARWFFLHRPNYVKLAIASRSGTISVHESLPFIVFSHLGYQTARTPGWSTLTLIYNYKKDYQRLL